MSEIRLAPRVLPELAEAMAWHEAQRTGQAADLANAIESAIEEIGKWPDRWPFWRVGRPYRRRVLRTVPYAVFYVFEEDVVEIIAVAHTSRRPGYWLKK